MSEPIVSDAELARLGLPSDAVMRMMSKAALETATAMLAEFAEDFARDLPTGTDGPTALQAFANAIRSTNAKRFPVGDSPS